MLKLISGLIGPDMETIAWLIIETRPVKVNGFSIAQVPILKAGPVFLFITVSYYDRLPCMYTLPIILFCCGVVLGSIHAYFTAHTALNMIFSIAVGGFLGSALGGVAFMYVYLRHQEPETDDPCPAGEMLEASHPHPLLPRPPQNLPQGQPSQSPDPLLKPGHEADISPGADTAPGIKAAQTRDLKEKTNALKNKKKGN